MKTTTYFISYTFKSQLGISISHRTFETTQKKMTHAVINEMIETIEKTADAAENVVILNIIKMEG